jgi:hypothetical protein
MTRSRLDIEYVGGACQRADIGLLRIGADGILGPLNLNGAGDRRRRRGVGAADGRERAR